MLNLKAKSFDEALDATPELRTNGNWLCLNIDSRTAWPTKPQVFTFEGRQIWVMPVTTDRYPGLATNNSPDIDRDECFALLHRALSVLTWLQDGGAVVAHMSGGSRPSMMGMRQSFGYTIRDDFDLSDLPIVGSASGKLALALMREGRGLNLPAYSFLSFYRVLEVAFPNGSERGVWMTENIDRIDGHRASDALDKLKATVQGDVGIHLYKSSRQAVAHARADPIVNPDNPRDARRLEEELPVIEALAVLAIETRLGIQTRHSAWRKHLYELRGWRSILPPTIIEASLTLQPEDVRTNIDLPLINFRLRRSEPFPLFEGMIPWRGRVTSRKVELVYRSADGLVELTFWLNFAEERFEFDPDRSVKIQDDGSAAVARRGKERCRFIWDYLGNGEIQVWNADTGDLISRVDAFLPTNMMPNRSGYLAELAQWDKLIDSRERAEASTAG